MHALSTLPGTLSGQAPFLGFSARSTRLTPCSCTVSGVVQRLGEGGGGLEQMSDAEMFQNEQRSSLTPLPVAHSGLL